MHEEPELGVGPYNLCVHRHRFAGWAARAAVRRVRNLRSSYVIDWMTELGLVAFIHDWNALPEPADFDARHEDWRNELINMALGQDVNLTPGTAAKLINVYLKAGVVNAFSGPGCQVPPVARAKIGAIHPPIDRILRDRIVGAGYPPIFPAGWMALCHEGYQNCINAVRDIAAKRGYGGQLWMIEEFWQP